MIEIEITVEATRRKGMIYYPGKGKATFLPLLLGGQNVQEWDTVFMPMVIDNECQTHHRETKV